MVETHRDQIGQRLPDADPPTAARQPVAAHTAPSRGDQLDSTPVGPGGGGVLRVPQKQGWGLITGHGGPDEGGRNPFDQHKPKIPSASGATAHTLRLSRLSPRRLITTSFGVPAGLSGTAHATPEGHCSGPR